MFLNSITLQLILALHCIWRTSQCFDFFLSCMFRRFFKTNAKLQWILWWLVFHQWILKRFQCPNNHTSPITFTNGYCHFVNTSFKKTFQKSRIWFHAYVKFIFSIIAIACFCVFWWSILWFSNTHCFCILTRETTLAM